MSWPEIVWVAGWAVVALVVVGAGLLLYLVDANPDSGDIVFFAFMAAVMGALWPLAVAVGLPWLGLTSLHRRIHPQTRIPRRDLRRQDP